MARHRGPSSFVAFTQPACLSRAILHAMDEDQDTTQGSSSEKSPEDVKRESEQKRKEGETSDVNEAAQQTKRDSNW
jgi:hypothetical protein